MDLMIPILLRLGKKGYSPRPDVNNLMDEMALVWDSTTKNYFFNWLSNSR